MIRKALVLLVTGFSLAASSNIALAASRPATPHQCRKYKYKRHKVNAKNFNVKHWKKVKYRRPKNH